MRNKLIAFVLVMVLANLTFSQNKVSLLDTEKIKDYLTLSEDQYKTINPMIEQIKWILDEDKKIIAELKERVKNGDEPGFFEKIGVKRGRDSRADDIEDLIEEIEDQLNDQQKNKFKNIEKPELKALDKKEIFGK
jgi:hypothetical protein